MTDLAQQLRAANNAQLGSLGEFLFAEVARQKLNVVAVATRRGRIDFVCGDRRVSLEQIRRARSSPHSVAAIFTVRGWSRQRRFAQRAAGLGRTCS